MNDISNTCRRVLCVLVGALVTALPFSSVLAAPTEGSAAPLAAPLSTDGTLADVAENDATTVYLNAEFFPDAAFRSWLINYGPLTGCQEGDALTPAKLAEVTMIRQINSDVQSLEGMRYFPNLTRIDIINGQLRSLDASGNPKLTRVDCVQCPLTEVNLSGLEDLQVLDLSYSYIESLDLSTNTAIKNVSLIGAALLAKLKLPPAPNEITHLLCSNTSLSNVDLTGSPNMVGFACAHADLATLDASKNTKLEVFQVNGNDMVSIHGPGENVTIPTKTLDPQRSRMIGVSPGGGDFDLRSIDPNFNGDCVTNDVSKPAGAKIEGTFVRNIRPGQTISYTYTDGGMSVNCELLAASGNSWVIPLSIRGWIEGQAPNSPTAQPLVGQVEYTYAPVGADGTAGEFSAEVPVKAGTYVCRATVPAGPGYGELVAQVSFTITPSQDAVPIPQNITAPYRTPLNSVQLPSGFAWAPGVPTFVGNVGSSKFAATYTIPNSSTVVSCEIPVYVVPRNGKECDIPKIENEEDVRNLTIRLGTYTLEKGKDYVVSSNVSGNEVEVVITFKGNFVGMDIQKFTFDADNEWLVAPSIADWVAGETPSKPQAAAKYGTPVFEYEDNGSWQTEQPTAPGKYKMRATVPGSQYYGVLTGEADFTIYRAVAPEAGNLEATYLDLLGSVRLPSGFTWNDPSQLVGDAGVQRHAARYTPEADNAEYMGGQVELSVTVRPRNGELCEISPVTNEYESKHITITDNGATLQSGVDYTVGSDVSGNTVRVIITFRGNYTGTVERSFTFASQNAWVQKLSIEDWSENEAPSQPQAAAMYGTPTFSYEVNGQWQSDPPRTAGEYRCRAEVAATTYYSQLEDIVSFTVYESNAPSVDGLTAIYGQRLSDVMLPPGFAWTNPRSYVGEVGTNSFPATYTPPAGSGDEYLGGAVTLSVEVGPRNGELCEISPITNEYDARTITVTDQRVVLRKGVDYEVSWSMEGSSVTVVITFEGNYYGTVTRTFSVNKQNGWIVPLSISDWRVGDVPVEPIAEPMYGEASFSYLVNGSWQDYPPSEVGTYTVRATVPATAYYEGLEAQENFQVVPADAELPGSRIVAVRGSNVAVRQEPIVGRTLVGPGLVATSAGHPVSEVLLMLEADPHEINYELQIVNPQGAPQNASVIVGTGCMARLVNTSDGRVLDQVTIVVSGDVLGTGQLTLSQVVAMAEAYRNPDGGRLTGAHLLAGDFYSTGGIALSDLVTEAQLYRESVTGSMV